MARWDDAPSGARAVRDYGSRVGVACFFAGLAFGVVFALLDAGSSVRAIGAAVLALAALVNAWRTVRRTPTHSLEAADVAHEAAYLETRRADLERAPRISPPHGSRTFQ